MARMLEHFVVAQEPVYETVRAELRAGHKRTHWMWFIFPQLAGLGTSVMAQKFGIASLDQANDYVIHPVLGPRLIECTNMVNRHLGLRAEDIFGEIDALKFCSSMTLFAVASPEHPVFETAINAFCNGRFDPLTLARL
ncbi:calpastatin [Devosia sp. H5989]|nr:calpastatin [Devosia sp. H5989]